MSKALLYTLIVLVLSTFAGPGLPEAMAQNRERTEALQTRDERARELASLRVLGYTRGEASFILLGELSLDGRIKPVRGVLPIAVAARRWGDQALILPVVTNRLAHGGNPARQGRFRDDPAFPYHFDQFVLADHAVAIFDQKLKKAKHLRFDRDRALRTAQFQLVGIKNEI